MGSGDDGRERTRGSPRYRLVLRKEGQTTASSAMKTKHSAASDLQPSCGKPYALAAIYLVAAIYLSIYTALHWLYTGDWQDVPSRHQRSPHDHCCTAVYLSGCLSNDPHAAAAAAASTARDSGGLHTCTPASQQASQQACTPTTRHPATFARLRTTMTLGL